MNTTQVLTARRWIQMAGFGLVLAVVIVAVTALVLPAAALLLTLALLVIGATFVAQQVRTAARTAREAMASVTTDTGTAPEILQLELADGSVVQARPVMLPRRQEHTMVLTRNGYLLLNAENEVFYRL